MRGVDAVKIQDFLASYAESGSSPSLGFNPVPDEKVVFSNYTERALQDQQATIVNVPPIPKSKIATLLTKTTASHHRHKHRRRRAFRPV